MMKFLERVSVLIAVVVMVTGCAHVYPPADVPGFEDNLVAVSLNFSAMEDISNDLIRFKVLEHGEVNIILLAANAAAASLDQAWAANDAFIADESTAFEALSAIHEAEATVSQFREIVLIIQAKHVAESLLS
jgi:hypothetical protein